MGRAPCCDKTKVKRGPWSPDEDATLRNFIQNHGTAENWIVLPQKAGLKRCGKSCRLRWLNYLRPNIKHGGFTEEEDNFILKLYHNIGSRWSIIASRLPGRTDNDVKNYWNTKLKKKYFFLSAPTITSTTSESSEFSINNNNNVTNHDINMLPYNYNNNSNNNSMADPQTLAVQIPVLQRIIPQNYIQASAGSSSSLISVDDNGISSSDLTTELMSFDYLLNDFYFQEIIPNFT